MLKAISCDHDGVTLEGQVAKPQGDGPFPAVLVMHSALGLGEHVQERTARLAGLGYVAVATNMYSVPLPEDPTKVGMLMVELHENPDLLRARTVAWFEAAAALPYVDASRIAAIGFCFGGQCVLELARSGANVKAVVSYHGLLTTHRPAERGAIKGDVIAYCGAKDPYAPLDQVDGLRDEMTAAEARYQITTFGYAAHSFTDASAAAATPFPGIEYDAMADRLSWAGTVAVLEAVLRD